MAGRLGAGPARAARRRYPERCWIGPTGTAPWPCRSRRHSCAVSASIRSTTPTRRRNLTTCAPCSRRSRHDDRTMHELGYWRRRCRRSGSQCARDRGGPRRRRQGAARVLSRGHHHRRTDPRQDGAMIRRPPRSPGTANRKSDQYGQLIYPRGEDVGSLTSNPRRASMPPTSALLSAARNACTADRWRRASATKKS